MISKEEEALDYGEALEYLEEHITTEQENIDNN